MQRVAWFFIVLMVNQIAFPAAALALTSGPSQPEVQSFQPVGTTEMVNLFSGDFNYNIPLFEVPGPDGGYPVNLFYNSVTDANTEASWTGLGWNINVGSLSRSMRGLPDDFNGEIVTRKLDMLKNETIVAGSRLGVEIGGYDGATDILKHVGLSLSLNTNYTYNSYRGAGFSIDPTIGLKGSFGNEGSGIYKPKLSLGLNLSSTSMASLNTSFSMTKETDAVSSNFNFGLSFNGREGLSSMSLGYSLSSNEKEEGVVGSKQEGKTGYNPAGGGVSASYSFARTAYTPEVKIPWTGWNLSGSFSFAPGAAVVYATFGFNGSYSVQHVKDAGIPQPSKAFGYNYLQNALDDNRSLMDFNREKDGAVHRHNRFLATPSLSYDIYNVVGQGIGGMYRAHRSDYGFVYDPELFARTAGGSIGGQVGPHLKVGIDGSFNYSEQSNYRWPKYNGYFGNKNEKYGFKTAESGADFENVYYKTAGEMAAEPLDAYDYMGGDKPLRLKKNADYQYDGTDGGILEGPKVDESNGTLTADYEPIIKFNAGESKRKDRRPRNMAIQNISNNDLLDGNNNVVLPEYDIQYYDATTASNTALTQAEYQNLGKSDLSRTPNEQNAGFTALGLDGVRWVYGLPLQNTEQKEAIFSVDPVNNCSKRVFAHADIDGEIDYKRDGTHKYIDEKTLPQYAHSYMLTSVLGSDYVDIDNIPGPSDGDVGYWMKTNYVKLSNGYQWRAPFFGVNLIQGFENKRVDDMGSFMWGKREVYLPATIETKTHIAYFEVSQRKDARGAGAYVQNTGDGLGDYSYKLDKIKLYTKKEISSKGLSSAVPLKIVHFSYDYSLCPDVENNADATDNGKLTLKKVWFTYENNTRGALSPYVFKYENSNRAYNENALDRWGAYKALPANNECANLHNPYTTQFDLNDPNFKDQLDSDIASWHLSKIIMPSGAAMNIELERDDYAYVQDDVATQMQPIFALGITNDANENPDQGGFLSNDANLGQDERRVYFKLEHPLLPTEKEELKKYIEDLPLVKRKDGEGASFRQVYFKIRSNLKTATDVTNEYVTGYAEIENDGNGNPIIDFDTNKSPTDANGAYTEAYITLRTARKQVKGDHYHPMLMANWDFLKDNLPDRMFQINQIPDPENAVPQMAGFGAGLGAIFSGYYGFVKDRGFGQSVDVSQSFIKLNTPDKIKYGGGARVKQITMEDNWAPEANLTNTLGVVYDYTKTDADGTVYSSGVMENETTIGYDACALKYADIHEEIQSGMVKDVHIYEYPLNEGLYPGSGVGYSQVTVRSLASDYALRASKSTDRATFLANNNLPDGFGTTGQTVHEFYTAKDFPVVTDKTDLEDTETDPWLSMMMSFLVLTRRDEYTGTQGYSIELNNMHGQMKGQKTYAQDNTGKVLDKPLTEVSYEYKSKTKYIKDRGAFKTVRVLDNEVDVLIADDPNDTSPGNLDAKVEPRLVGVDYDFVMDGRESTSVSTSGGVAVNIDVTLIYPVPFPWPQFNLNGNRTRLAVTNKVINKRGIMTKMHAYDGQSHITTYNEVFDKYTGQPILKYTHNQMGGGIYNYTAPAYLAHSTLGMAADNVGMKFNGTLTATAHPNEFVFQGVSPSNVIDELIPGDEYIVYDELNNQTAKSRAVYLGNNLFSLENVTTFNPLGGNTSSLLSFNTVRSGNKNMLSASIAQYSTVDHREDNVSSNPMTGRRENTCTTKFIDFQEVKDGEYYADFDAYMDLVRSGLTAYQGLTINDYLPYPNYKCPNCAPSTSSFVYKDIPLTMQQIRWAKDALLLDGTVDLSARPAFRIIKGTNIISMYGNSKPTTNIVLVFYQGGMEEIIPFNWYIKRYNMTSGVPYDNIEEGGLNIFVNNNFFQDHLGITGGNPTPVLGVSDQATLYENMYDLEALSHKGPCMGGVHNRLFSFKIDGSKVPTDFYQNSNDPTSEILTEKNNGAYYEGIIYVELKCGDYYKPNLVESDPQTIQYKEIDQVLSASASAYSDEWNVEDYDHCAAKNPWQNPYTKGEKGVWRAKSTYAYIDNRDFVTYHPNANTNLNDVDIKKSGTVDQVPLFNWTDPFFEYCNHNWVRTEDVTKYNLNGAAVEARDILGNHQAEVYGYNNNIVVAKGVNTRYYEMGYEGFEEPGVTGSIHNLAAAGHYNNGNLDFLPFTNCATSTIKRQENYRLCYPTKLSASGNTAYILLHKPYDPLGNLNLSGISLSLTNGTSKIKIPTTTEIREHEVDLGASGPFQIPGLAPVLDETTKGKFTVYGVTIPSRFNLGAGWWAGDATLIYEQDLAAVNTVLPSNSKAQFSTEKAHTGKYSLKLVMGANDLLQFPQNTLHLQTGKAYMFSAWINVASTFGGNSTVKHSYDDGQLEIRMGGTLMKPKGAIIEGWQRVEGKFTYTGNNDLSILDNAGARMMYVDDVRIYPADANMQSYVYNPVNYRLKATLDNNNYATFYVYDEDGSLILVKRETERGIKTIQESRSYVKSHNQ